MLLYFVVTFIVKCCETVYAISNKTLQKSQLIIIVRLNVIQDGSVDWCLSLCQFQHHAPFDPGM